MTEWKVGQEVIVTASSGRVGTEEAVVAKVGRKYVTVGEDWRARRFEMDTGYEHTKWGAGGRIYTLDGWEDKKRRDVAIEAMKGLGWSPRGYGTPDTPTHVIEKWVYAARMEGLAT